MIGESRAKAMKAKCKECMHHYVDGRRDCEVPVCPLYPWMQYRAGRKDEPKRERTPAQIAATETQAERLRSMRKSQ